LTKAIRWSIFFNERESQNINRKHKKIIKGGFMKKLILVFMLLALVACAGGKQYSLPPEAEQNIKEVKNTHKCKFIKKASAKGISGLNLTRDIQLTVYNLGGDSYKIISTSNETKGNVSVTNAKFQVWKCK
jgi:hypothetical protein